MSAPTGALTAERYSVASSDSSLTFEARSTLHPVRGKTSALDGYIEAAWSADGTLAAEPSPKMHIEFAVERLSSGNGLQDREMWRMIDSKRFPRISADLRDVKPAVSTSHYAANGEVTLAGRSCKYDGELTIVRNGDGVIIDGNVSVDIRDFGLKAPSLLLIKVDPVVKISLHLVARKAA